MPELSITEQAWASASGSRPRVSISSIAPCFCTGVALSRSVTPSSASLTLYRQIGSTCRPGTATSGTCGVVTSTRPQGPAGHRSSSSFGSGRSSRTTSHCCVVSPSQLRNRAATDSDPSAGSRPVTVAEACAYPDRTAARSVALIQTSTSMAPDRHSDSAIHAASWVLPEAPSQFLRPSANEEAGTSTRDVPASSMPVMLRAMSARAANPGATGGTAPTRIRCGPWLFFELLLPACLAPGRPGIECATAVTRACSSASSAEDLPWGFLTGACPKARPQREICYRNSHINNMLIARHKVMCPYRDLQRE